MSVDTTSEVHHGAYFPRLLQQAQLSIALRAFDRVPAVRPSGPQVRIVKVEQEMRGKRLKPGDRLFMMLNAANRDTETQEQPDRLRLGRGGPASLTFGFGMHICLGFPLARMEGQVALPAVAQHWEKVGLAVPEGRLPWLNSLVSRGITFMLRVAAA